jgi:response regulator RpfG family c-di-GMP phosphodiesterase
MGLHESNEPHEFNESDETPTMRSLLFVERAPILLPVKKTLRKQNWFIFECPSPEQALHLLQVFQFDFILIDLFLSGQLSSYDFCKKLKENSRTERLPLFLFCGHPLPLEIARNYLFELKADRLILPPFEPAHLYQQICLILQPR